MKQLLISISLLIAVSGCSLIPTKPVEVNTIALPAPMYHPPLPLEIQAVEYLQLVEEGKAPAVAYYALTTPQYENLSMNMAEITRYTKNILSIVEYYKEYDNDEE